MYKNITNNVILCTSMKEVNIMINEDLALFTSLKLKAYIHV